MGLFDLFGDLAPELKELGNELQGIKDEFISSVVDPTGELRDTITGIASDLTGQATAISDDASTAVQDVKGAADSMTKSIPVINGNE
ncbi:MAG: hypothetical protein V4611_01910 [Patescibacteria group bacterium]